MIYFMDKELLSRYPGLDNVASFLGAVARFTYYVGKKYQPFNDLGIKTEEEFIKLIEFDNENAVGLYKRVKETLNF